MNIVSLSISDVKLIEISKHVDGRGFFSETWNRKKLREHGIDVDFQQENHSLSLASGVLRGLHFQSPPHAQTKLVRVVRGSIQDVAVDIRLGSPTYGRWVSAELSADNWRQMLIPKGFAHGFVTLEPEVEVVYMVDAPYAAESDNSIVWNDPDLAIDWRIAPSEITLSEKDRAGRAFAQFDSPFAFAAVAQG